MTYSLKSIISSVFIFILLCELSVEALAHNGAVAHAYPMDHIKIDGNLSEWTSVKKYAIDRSLSELKPQQAADLSGYFQIGYHTASQSVYIAFEINDDDYVQDTSRQVAWNTQDAVELYLDIRHQQSGSGVASYLYSETFKHIDNSRWDPVTKLASWDRVEVSLNRMAHKTIYEWKIAVGSLIEAGRTIGFDVHLFDKDRDGFGWNGWGIGDYKFRNPNSLGDILLLPAKEIPENMSGRLEWNKKLHDPLTSFVRLTSTSLPDLWVTASVDSTGNYSTMLPKGNYRLSLADRYIPSNNKVYKITTPAQSMVHIGAKPIRIAPVLKAEISDAPDLIPLKGLLHQFNSETPRIIDQFIHTYQMYYHIPGVSLALIKDGKVIYHKTYGVKNTITKIPVDGNTLFEAASVTKPVFAFAVQRLKEKGIIDLDKPLYEYLPYEDIAYDDRYKLMTARHVLTHRTGFPNWRYMNPDGKLNLKFTPGTDYNYSGEGFEYLKKVVEQITGKKVEQILAEEVINPIGLYHTYFSKNDTLEKLVCTGHFDNIPSGDGLPETTGMAYSMHTEANAFTRFMLYLLNEQGLKPESYKDMLRVHSEYKKDKPEDKSKFHEYMGISLNIRETPYGLVFGHGGNNGDFRCEFEVYKDLKMGYVIFTNSSTAYPMIAKMKTLLVEGK